MALAGWYYLHTTGELIYKPEFGGTAADIRESDFARMLWPMDPSDRAGAWRTLIEALACGANKPRVEELARKWGCTDADAAIYAGHIGAKLQMDGNSWCATRGDFANLQESPAGFGESALEALSDLCKALGFRPAKMWGSTFADLVAAT